jgi:iron complex transport system substrate-binding protein
MNRHAEIKRKAKQAAALVLSIFMVMALITGCGGPGSSSGSGSRSARSSSGSHPDISGLKYQSSLKLDYAKQFQVYRYQGGYKVISIKQEGSFLVVPKGKSKPKGLSDDITVIRQPLKNVYLAATAAMSLLCDIQGDQAVRMSSIRASEWSFSEPKKRMEKKEMLFAGKYSEPDYELLVKEKCDLALESTMIYHTPEVKNMIEKLHIPVLVDRSSFEDTPLGRMEWIKLYGVLMNRESQAEKFFNKQEEKTRHLKKGAHKTVAFFYISTDGKAVVRRSDDYVPAIIKMAGGTYAYDSVGKTSKSISVPMNMEKFYELTKDADIIVYNGSIDSSVRTLADLKAKDPAIWKLKAVRDGNCWIAGSSMYQRPDQAGDIIVDFNTLIQSKNPSGMRFIQKLK